MLGTGNHWQADGHVLPSYAQTCFSNGKLLMFGSWNFVGCCGCSCHGVKVMHGWWGWQLKWDSQERCVPDCYHCWSLLLIHRCGVAALTVEGQVQVARTSPSPTMPVRWFSATWSPTSSSTRTSGEWCNSLCCTAYMLCCGVGVCATVKVVL